MIAANVPADKYPHGCPWVIAANSAAIPKAYVGSKLLINPTENLSKRLSILFGSQKATISVQGKILLFVEHHLKNEIVKVDNFFYAPANYDEIVVRIPRSGDKIRPINYISTPEIAKAMYCVASKCYGIKAEDLFIATAREFGFNRTGSNITYAMQNAFDHLLKSERIQEGDEGKVIHVNA